MGIGCHSSHNHVFTMLVDCFVMDVLDQLAWIGLAVDNGCDARLVAPALDLRDIVAQVECAALQGVIQLVGVVASVFIEVEDAAVVLAHVLHNRLGHETTLDEIFQQTLRYPLRVLDIALATGQLLDEKNWIYQLERHAVAQSVPYRHPIGCRALHRSLGNTMADHVSSHLMQVGGSIP